MVKGGHKAVQVFVEYCAEKKREEVRSVVGVADAPWGCRAVADIAVVVEGIDATHLDSVALHLDSMVTEVHSGLAIVARTSTARLDSRATHQDVVEDCSEHTAVHFRTMGLLQPMLAMSNEVNLGCHYELLDLQKS